MADMTSDISMWWTDSESVSLSEYMGCLSDDNDEGANGDDVDLLLLDVDMTPNKRLECWSLGTPRGDVAADELPDEDSSLSEHAIQTECG